MEFRVEMERKKEAWVIKGCFFLWFLFLELLSVVINFLDLTVLSIAFIKKQKKKQIDKKQVNAPKIRGIKLLHFIFYCHISEQRKY